MYNIGTVTTTANSPKITGTGTRWKDNTTLISVGQVVLIENGANLLINSIYSIESNTALTLAFPLSAKLTNAKYIILTTMIDSISDGVNKATAQVIASEAYTDILNQWMTAQGTIDVELPTGQKVKLRTVAEMDKQLDGKLDKTGGELSDSIKIKKSGSAIQVQRTGVQSSYVEFLDVDGARRALIGYGDAADNLTFMNSKSGGIIRITGEGKTTINGIEAMKVGDYGFGGNGSGTGLWANWTTAQVQDFFKTGSSSIWRNQQESTLYGARYGASMYVRSSDTFWNMNVNHSDAGATITSGLTGSDPSTFKVAKLYSTLNTTKDANGNLKAASPIIKVFADHIELNEESEGVELEKLSAGRYKLKGTLGMNSDASWGGYHGGLVIPNGINNLPLVWADFKIEADGDIIIETHYRKHADLPPPVVLNRLITYPEFMDENGNELDSYTPCDIPNGHWIDVRVNMPSDSLYNQKQAETQRLAEIEAERLAKEEAERIAEEAERVEKEAIEQTAE